MSAEIGAHASRARRRIAFPPRALERDWVAAQSALAELPQLVRGNIFFGVV
jgi:hypothetical protein